jgi:general secretion pathway protein D
VSEITGKNFIVDPRVEGKVNVISNKPMRPSEIYEVFESVLRVHGYAAVPSGSVIKILPDVAASQDGSGLGDAAGPDSLVTRVIELRHVSAIELQPSCAPWCRSRASSRCTVEQLADRHRPRRQHRAHRGAAAQDRPGRRRRGRGDPLAHANATEMSRTLTLLADDKAGQLNGTSQAKVYADARTNSLLLSGDKAARLRMRALVAHLDTPIDTGEGTEVVYLHYAKAAELAPILEGVASTLTGQNPANKDQAKSATIQAHSETNALVITADPAVFRALSVIVRKLDVPRLQVHIEGVVAEVSDELANEVGVQFQATGLQKDADGNITGGGVIGGTNFTGANGSGNILGASISPLSVGQGLNIGYVTGTIKLPGSDKAVLEIGALVRALKIDAKNNVLSTPSVVTLDNRRR